MGNLMPAHVRPMGNLMPAHVRPMQLVQRKMQCCSAACTILLAPKWRGLGFDRLWQYWHSLPTLQ